MRRAILLLTMTMTAVLVSFSGIVLAQPGSTRPDEQETTAPDSAQKDNKKVRPEHYIVVLNDEEDSKKVAKEHTDKHGARVENIYEFSIKGYAGKIPASKLEKIKADPQVEFVEQDSEVEAFAQTMPFGVNRVEADRSATAAIAPTTGSDPVVDIAVLDTGIDKNHTDLNRGGGYNCTSSTRSAWNDGNGHGTHVAGTIGAKDNTNGVVGVAPGAKLWAMKVLGNSGSGYRSWVICGIDRVSRQNGAPDSGGVVRDTDPSNNIEVANMSLGGAGQDKGNCGNGQDSYHLAICKSVNANGTYGSYPGTTYVVAAGNSAKDLKDFVPAAYDEVLSVTAMTDSNGAPGGTWQGTCRTATEEKYASFSNYATPGSPDEGHTIAAPGVCIRSTWKGGGYNTISGTSMASPHIAGIAALYRAKNPSAKPSDVMSALRNDAESWASSNGFTGDPRTSPTEGRYYGYLAHADGY